MGYVFDDGCCPHGKVFESVSSPETTPAGVLALDAERLAAAIEWASGQFIAAGNYRQAAEVIAAKYAALSSPETTPALDAGLDVERLARAMAEDDDIDEQQWIEWGKGSFRDWARIIAAEYAALGRSGSGGGRG